MDGKFSVIVIDGNFSEIGDIYSSTESVRFDGLSWEDSVTLARLSFDQGFEIVIWKIDEDAKA